MFQFEVPSNTPASPSPPLPQFRAPAITSYRKSRVWVGSVGGRAVVECVRSVGIEGQPFPPSHTNTVLKKLEPQFRISMMF